MRWHILAPEYPPSCGGVGDYTALLGHALVGAGDSVRIWHPARAVSRDSGAEEDRREDMRITPVPGRFGPSARTLIDRGLIEEPGTVLVQYVPSGFGARGLNLPFCRWLLGLRRRGIDVRVMFHEPFFYFSLERPWRNVLALTQRLMAAVLLRASPVIYLSTERWIEYLSPYGSLPEVHVLPIPATISVDVSHDARGPVRMGRIDGDFVVGHFGTYGDHVGHELRQVLPLLLARARAARVLLIGEGSEPFVRSLRLDPDHAARVHPAGRLSSADAAAALRGCDVLVQPYPDGATTRRTSLMACLTSGRPVVTTDGPLTERVWHETRAVAFAPAGNAAALVDAVLRLAADSPAAAALGAQGRRLYDDRFAIEHTIAVLRRSVAPPAAVGAIAL